MVLTTSELTVTTECPNDDLSSNLVNVSERSLQARLRLVEGVVYASNSPKIEIRLENAV